MSVLTDVADLLVTDGIVTADQCFLSELPDTPSTPATVVVMYETPGMAPGFVHGKMGPAYEYPRLRVLVRSIDYETSYNKAQAIFRLLGSVVNTTLGGVWYLRIKPMASPAQVQRDQNDRILMMMDFQVSKESVDA
jgi:hypothetical protein